MLSFLISVRTRLVVVALFGLGLSGSPLAAQIPGSETDVPVFRVGDAVRVTVWANEDLSGQFEIAEDGTVLHPLYREITIAGLSLRQAETEFRRLLQRYESNPQFVVEPLFQIPVGGQVAAPSVYSLPPYSTPAIALLLAGGPTAEADLARARLIRDGRELVVDLRDPNNPFVTTRIRSGDQIILERDRSIWRDTIEPVLSSAGSIASLAYLFLRVADIR